MIDAATLERALQDEWGIHIRAIVTERLFDMASLTAEETRNLESLSNPRRQESWLRGRTALKDLLAVLGETADTSLLRFPHPRISLTHSGAWAIALGTHAPTAGLGIDLELRSPPRPETVKFFLTPEEQPLLKGVPPTVLLRLWTIKEATFKADPDNAFTSVRAYRVEDLQAPSGTITVGPKSFRYRTFEVPGGFLSATMLPRVERPGGGK